MEEAVVVVGKDLGSEICGPWVANLRRLVGWCDIFLAIEKEKEKEIEMKGKWLGFEAEIW